MPCGRVLIWLVLSHYPKAGCCHGLNNLHALWLSVAMALLSQCPKAGCCHRLDSPRALRLGVLMLAIPGIKDGSAIHIAAVELWLRFTSRNRRTCRLGVPGLRLMHVMISDMVDRFNVSQARAHISVGHLV